MPDLTQAQKWQAAGGVFTTQAQNLEQVIAGLIELAKSLPEGDELRDELFLKISSLDSIRDTMRATLRVLE